MVRPIFPVFLAISLLAGTAEAAPEVFRDRQAVRVDRSARLSIGTDAGRHGRLTAALVAGGSSFGLTAAARSGLALQTTVRPIAGKPVEVVHVHGTVDGVPLSRPVAHALIDLADGGRVRLLTTEGAVPPRANMKISLTTADALTELGASGLPGSSGAAAAELVAVPGISETRFMYRVDPPLDLRHVTNPVYLVDAETGVIRESHDKVQFAKVRTFETNPVSTPNGGDYDVIDIDPNATHLIGPYFESKTCNEEGGWNCTANALAVPDADGNFLYPLPDVSVPGDNVQPDDIFGEVSMYYHADKFLDHLKGFGFAGLECHLDDQRGVLVANYKKIENGDWTPYDNAFFSGDCDRLMVFGQGTDVDFSYDGDVIYHELGHGVVGTQREGGWLGGSRLLDEARAVDAGGINEAIADYVSSSFSGDPLVGNYVGAYWTLFQEIGGIRDNSNSFVCPDDLLGEVHLDGEPFAALMWYAHQELGDAMIPVVLEATTLMPSDALLDEASASLAEVAGMLIDDAARTWIENEADNRGMGSPCLRVTAPENLRREMFVRDVGNYVPFSPPPLQLRVDVPAAAETIEISFTARPRTSSFGGGADNEVLPVLAVKEGSPITYSYNETADAMEVEADWDELHESLGMDGFLTFPVSGGSTLYLGFGNVSENEMLVEDIEVVFPGVGGGTGTGTGGTTGGEDSTTGGGATGGGTTGSTGATTDATSGTDGTDGTDGDGDGSADGSGDGCGCATSPTPSAPWILAVPALLRRRRRA